MKKGHEILKAYPMPSNMREQIAAAIDKELAKAKEEQRIAIAEWGIVNGWWCRGSSVYEAILNNKG